jgi:hypothetical protein
MELRRSIREKTAKRSFNLSDDEEDVVTKKVKSTAKKSTQLSLGAFGIGKRNRKKNSNLEGYQVGDDSDSDFEVGTVDRSEIKSKKKRGTTKAKAELAKVEFILDWKREMQISDLPTDAASFKIAKHDKIVETDLTQYASSLQAIFMNVKWQTKFSPEGVKIEDLRKLELNKKLVRNGIVFVWSEKEILGRLIHYMEEKGFFYVENFVVALLDASKAQLPPKKVESDIKSFITSNKSTPAENKAANSPNTSDTNSTTESTKISEENALNEDFLLNMGKYTHLEADKLFYEGTADYFKISKRVLMMFRRTDPKEPLELRHQRTSDALFDLVDPSSPSGGDLRTKEFVYKLIETLLPKAAYLPENKGALKMMELWADPTRPREGWINVCENPEA